MLEQVAAGIIDSGATVCICGIKCMFTNLKACYIVVTCANGESMVCERMGTLTLSHNGNLIAIDDCLFIPGCMTLISVHQLTKMGLHILFYDTGMCAYKTAYDVRKDTPFIKTEKQITDKMWTIPIKAPSPYANAVTDDQLAKSERSFSAMQDSALGEWSAGALHEAHYHASLPVLKKLYPHLEKVDKLPPCDACMSQSLRLSYSKKPKYNEDFIHKSKLSKVKFITTNAEADHVDGLDLADAETAIDPSFTARESPNQEPATRPEVKITDPQLVLMTGEAEPNIEVTTVDMGLVAEEATPQRRFGRYLNSDTKYVKTESVRGYRYLFIVVDKDTRVTFGFLGVSKSDFEPIAKRWIRKFFNVYQRYPEWWKFDQGGEFLSNDLTTELQKRGVTFVFSTTKAHNQNAYSERKIGVVWNAVLKTLAGSAVPMQFWCYCAVYAIFVMNHLPHRGISNGVPLTRANMRTRFEHIYPFGCEVWFVNENAVSNESRSKRGVFLGVSPTKMGYDVLDIETRQVIVTRNVHFMPSRKPFLIAQKPCKIHLDFGTWPSANASDRVSLPVVPNTVQFEQPVSDEGGEFRVITTPPHVPQTRTVQPPVPPGSNIFTSPVPVTDELTTVEPVINDESTTVDPVPNDPPSTPSMSPIPESTPDRRWTSDLFEISPELRGERTPVFPSRVDEPDEKHTDHTDVSVDKTVFHTHKTVNVDPRTVTVDDETVNSEKIKNIQNPMSKIIDLPHSVTPGEINVPSSAEPINIPLDDSTENNGPLPAKGAFKPLDLRPAAETTQKRKRGRPIKAQTKEPKKYLVDLRHTVPPVRIETNTDVTSDTQYELEEIVDRQIVEGAKGKDKYQYRVKWKDLENVKYPELSWVPGSNIDDATRRWYNRTHHPKPPKQRKGGARVNGAPKTRSTTGTMTLRNRKLNSLNEQQLEHNVVYALNDDQDRNASPHDHFGYVPVCTGTADRIRAENSFALWNKSVDGIDKSRTDDMSPIEPIEKSLHRSFETIAALNTDAYLPSSLRNDKASKKGKKKVRINDTVSITDVTDEEIAKSNMALQLAKMDAKESVYVDADAYEEVLQVRNYGSVGTDSPDTVPHAESVKHNAKDARTKQPRRAKRSHIPLPPENRRVVPIPHDDIPLEELMRMSELAFSNYIDAITSELCMQASSTQPTSDTNAVSKEELTREAAASQKEAYNSPQRDYYIEGEHKELKGLHNHGTFVETYCPPGRTPITCRWAYDLKRDKNGKIVLYKARLVVHGFKQVAGIDFNKTFSSTAQLRTFRFVVSIAVSKGYSMSQYDISQAFLNGTLEEELYMNFPPGYPSENKGTCLKLLKGLYGLKQASRIWQKTLYKVLKELGLVECKTESGVLRWPGNDVMALVVCWVDDLIVVTDNPEIRKQIEDKLNKEFLTKMMGELELYVGIVVQMEKNGDIVLHQGPYNRKVCAKFEVQRKFHANTPAPSDRLSKADCPVNSEDAVDYPYLSVTGSLLYAAICTRPDIFYAVMQLARFNSNPGKAHVRASEQCLRYLEETADLGIKYTAPKDKSAKIVINAFVDSDWGGCPDTRRSTSGYIIQVCGGPVSWKSKLMQTMALSSCEAEFMSLTEVCRELMWMCRFLDEIGLEYEAPNVYCDSSSAINWAEDPVQHQRNKHVEIKYYYCRDVVSDGKVRLFKIHTSNNVSDIMTKPVGRQIMQRLRPGVMGHESVVFDDDTSHI